MDRRFKQMFLQTRHADGQQTHKKMFNIAHGKKNANQVYSEVSSQTHQHGHHQKVYKEQMLQRVWRKRNPPALLVGMEFGAAIVDNSLEKLKNRATV